MTSCAESRTRREVGWLVMRTGQARARPATQPARVPVALEERTRLRRPDGGQALRGLGKVRLGRSSPHEEEGDGAEADGKRPQHGANDDAGGVHANVRA